MLQQNPLTMEAQMLQQHPLATEAQMLQQHPLALEAQTLQQHPLATGAQIPQHHPLATEAHILQQHPLATEVLKLSLQMLAELRLRFPQYQQLQHHQGALEVLFLRIRQKEVGARVHNHSQPNNTRCTRYLLPWTML